MGKGTCGGLNRERFGLVALSYPIEGDSVKSAGAQPAEIHRPRAAWSREVSRAVQTIGLQHLYDKVLIGPFGGRPGELESVPVNL